MFATSKRRPPAICFAAFYWENFIYFRDGSAPDPMVNWPSHCRWRAKLPGISGGDIGACLWCSAGLSAVDSALASLACSRRRDGREDGPGGASGHVCGMFLDVYRGLVSPGADDREAGSSSADCAVKTSGTAIPFCRARAESRPADFDAWLAANGSREFDNP